jgi:hypothetical protein
LMSGQAFALHLYLPFWRDIILTCWLLNWIGCYLHLCRHMSLRST